MISWARCGKSLFPPIFRICKEGNAEDTAGWQIFMQWVNQAAQTRSLWVGTWLGDGFWGELLTNDIKAADWKWRKLVVSLWLGDEFFHQINHFWEHPACLTHSRDSQGLFWGTACRADSGEHPHSGRTFNFRFHSEQMLQAPLHLANFNLILQVKHKLWLLPESKISRQMQVEIYGNAGISGRNKYLRWGANKMLIII